jgi:hypothetical protein
LKNEKCGSKIGAKSIIEREPEDSAGYGKVEERTLHTLVGDNTIIVDILGFAFS